ncbi:MAG TPA: hypothetical protein VN180_07455 [Acidimicrobiia bacterium]|nr:hypothetical protein [Acidimicrobiia bacterium]
MADTTQISAPPTEPTTGSAGGGGSVLHFGWRARTRPPGSLGHVLGAGAGAFAVLAVEALVHKIASGNPTAAGVILNGVLALVALGVAVVVVGPTRGAAVVALVFAVPVFWLYVFYGNNQVGAGWFRLVYALSALIFLGLYCLLWTRGRAIFLALFLLFATSYVGYEVHRQFETTHRDATDAQTIVPLLVPFDLVANPAAQSTVTTNAFIGNAATNAITRTGDVEAAVTLALGVAFLGVGAALNRRGYNGAAVPFLVVGAIEGFAAASVLGPNEHSITLGGLLAVTVGALLALGSAGKGRRAGVWIGVIAVVVSLSAVFVDATSNDLGLAGYYALGAVALLAIGTGIRPMLQEPVDDDDPPSV